MASPLCRLGLAGFICSLLGLVSCGTLFPIGLVGFVLSFIAMFKRPRGFAIAGFIIGLISWGWILVALVFIGLGGLLAAVGAAVGVAELEAHAELGIIASEVEAYRQANGNYPSTLTLLGLDTGTLDDPWGTTYRYAPTADGTGFTLSSDGPDGLGGTADDITRAP